MKVEYKIRKVTRYVITRYEESLMQDGTTSKASFTKGEYDNADLAYEVASALAKHEHEVLLYDVEFAKHPKWRKSKPR